MTSPLKTLAIDTSLRGGSVACFLGGELVGAEFLDSRQSTAARLTPTLQALLTRIGWKPAEIQLVGVSIGPGSFTGLRIGVMTAKTIAYVTAARSPSEEYTQSGAKVVGVNTLSAIAHRAPVTPSDLHVIMDAQRNQLFHARFVSESDGSWNKAAPTAIVDWDPFLDGLEEGSTVTGPALRSHEEKIPPNVQIMDEAYWSPTAEAVGRIALTQYHAGKTTEFWKLQPNYYRKSAAEEKLERGT